MEDQQIKAESQPVKAEAEPQAAHPDPAAKEEKPAVDVEMNDAPELNSGLTSGIITAKTSGTSTPMPVEMSKTQINAQRRSYFLEQHSSLNKQKLADSAKRFKYLIGLTDLFRHFINARAKTDPSFKRMLEELDEENAQKDEQKKSTDHRHRKTEKQEDAELLNEEEDESEQATVFTESPVYVQNGTMRDYQIQGLNWMISLYENNISGILADEMGLGKTLQTIAFLGYLRYFRGISGPHIVIVPKSTLDNWNKEFHKWTPEVTTMVLQGDKDSRAKLINERLLECDFDVCITSYEMVLREKHHLKKFAWQSIIVDEAHRIKNEESSLSQIIRLFNSRNRLLVTGTPLQNNLHELWALLNFILPDVFSDSQVFDEWFEGQNEDKDTVVQQLHRVLRPFLLRRIKADVEHSLLPKIEQNLYVGMSDMQLAWYKKLLEKDIDAVNGQVKKGEKTRLLNIVMQLRKCCNHPYLFEGAEPGPPYTTDEHLIYNCAKMVVLDKLLKRFKGGGDRVLIFSQMSRVLDIMEDYCLFRGYKYCRIDGQTAHEDRVKAIDEYNKPGSEKFIFLLTTRAGGLGINLTTANKVILYDSDWNPQADLQAMDRAHRIGQTKQVQVIRLVTEDSVEEKVLERAMQKLKLDQLVIQQGRAQSKQASNTSNNDLINMIQHGAQSALSKEANAAKKEITDGDLDGLLAQGAAKTQELNAKYDDLGLDGLQKFSSDSAYNWQGEDYKRNKKIAVVTLGKRARKEKNYDMEGYYKDRVGGRGPNAKKEPRPADYIQTIDHQFYPQKFHDLQQKKLAWFRKNLSEDQLKLVMSKYKEEEQEEIRQEMEEAEEWTDDEQEQLEKLAQDGFGDWARRDFFHFVQMSAKHGRKNYKAIASEFEDRTEDDIERYSKVFWRRYKEIEGHDRYISQIKQGEQKAQKVEHSKELIRQKVEGCSAPMQQMQLQYGLGHGKKQFSEEEDRFLVVQMHRFGLDAENLSDLIRDAIRDSPMFRFDWFFLSRNSMEITRRCNTLVSNITKELDPKSVSRRKSGKRSGDADDEEAEELIADYNSLEDEEEEEEEEMEEFEQPEEEEEVEYKDESEEEEEVEVEQPAAKKRKSIAKSNGNGNGHSNGRSTPSRNTPTRSSRRSRASSS